MHEYLNEVIKGYKNTIETLLQEGLIALSSQAREVLHPSELLAFFKRLFSCGFRGTLNHMTDFEFIAVLNFALLMFQAFTRGDSTVEQKDVRVEPCVACVVMCVFSRVPVLRFVRGHVGPVCGGNAWCSSHLACMQENIGWNIEGHLTMCWRGTKHAQGLFENHHFPFFPNFQQPYLCIFSVLCMYLMLSPTRSKEECKRLFPPNMATLLEKGTCTPRVCVCDVRMHATVNVMLHVRVHMYPVRTWRLFSD